MAKSGFSSRPGHTTPNNSSQHGFDAAEQADLKNTEAIHNQPTQPAEQADSRAQPHQVESPQPESGPAGDTPAEAGNTPNSPSSNSTPTQASGSQTPSAPSATVPSRQAKPSAAPTSGHPSGFLSRSGGGAGSGRHAAPNALRDALGGGSSMGLPPEGSFNPGSSRFRQVMTRHPKGVIWGIVALISALISFFIFLISVPFQLIHMAQILFDHNFGPGNRIEEKAGRQVMNRLFRTKSTTGTGAKKNTGHFIRDTLDNMQMDRFNKILAQEGLKLNFDPKTGRLLSLDNTITGESVKDFSNSSFMERRSAIGEIVAARVAPWNVLKRVHYTRLMQYHARVSFQFWPKEKVKDIRTLLTEKIRKGVSLNTLTTASKGSNTQVQQAQQQSSTNGTGAAADAIQATEDTYTQTSDKTAAIGAGESKLKAFAGKYGGLTGALAIACIIQQLAEAIAQNRYIERLDLLMRAGNNILTTSSQLLSGQNLDLDKLNQLMTRYNGDQSAPAGSVNRKAWDQSAAAKRINNEPVNSDPKSDTYNPDLSPSANPNSDALTIISSTISAFFSAIPGFNLVCEALNSIFGYLIQGIELVGAAISGGLEGAAAYIAKAAIQQLFMDNVVKWALEAATNLAVTGTENAIDMFNNADAGLSLSAQEYARSYGGRQLTNSEQVALINEANQEQVQIAREKGWFYRNLDLNNINSVASSFLVKVPTTTSTAVAAIVDLPRTFVTNFGAIFMGSFRPSLAAANTVNPYNFQFYGFTQAEINAYDPLANEDYLAQPIPGTTQTRLSVLGDPSKYSPVYGDDTNKGDLLHCFVNAPTVPGVTPDPICHGIGILTTNDGNVTNNPGDQVVRDLYNKAGLGNIGYDNDFLRYRLEMLYTHEARGLNCASTDQDCFAGANSPTP